MLVRQCSNESLKCIWIDWPSRTTSSLQGAATVVMGNGTPALALQDPHALNALAETRKLCHYRLQ